MPSQPTFFDTAEPGEFEEPAAQEAGDFAGQIARFEEFGAPSLRSSLEVEDGTGRTAAVDVFINEFWTAKQRAGHRLHEVSYRACFKPQLPAFFIERLTQPGDTVYDPFMGRGTTLIEAALRGRVPAGCDINPLSIILTRPRLEPSSRVQVQDRVKQIDLNTHDEFPEELLVFYEEQTLKQICALKKYLMTREQNDGLDEVDRWIRMVAVNRLTGHSPGFFSVYTMPPNQAVSIQSQQKINARRNQTPTRRDVARIILKKSRLLFERVEEVQERLHAMAARSLLMTAPASTTPQLADDSVQLVVTSPPFLDVVDYATDNWLRCWFCGIDAKAQPITMLKKLSAWEAAMESVLRELKRVLKPGGHIAFEVGEVRGGKVKLEESILKCGLNTGLQPVLVMINAQEFTKTANCWGVDNGTKGTNTNRIVVFQKS